MLRRRASATTRRPPAADRLKHASLVPPRMRALLVAASLLALGFLAPAASAAPTCTGYVNVLGSKQRTCVDPDEAPRCGAWSEGWSYPLGYWKSCYGTAATCGAYGCLDDVAVSTCLLDVCPAVGEVVVDLRWMTACPGPWGHEERTSVGPVTIVTYECDDGGA